MAGAKFEIGSVLLEVGDKFLAYTDGVTEARNGSRDFFTDERLLTMLDNKSATALDLLNCIEGSVKAFIGDAEPADDLTMLALRRTL
jgi:serine phosphatase RsbU (regulator of sigma subunit)